MAGKCARCGKAAHVRAELKKERREILLCTKHKDEHADALNRQKFVLTDL